MNYDNLTVRRQDRLLGKDEAIHLLNEGEYGFLSLGNEKGGYGIPISFVYYSGAIYFHSAPEGVKLNYIDKCRTACFCVVGSTAVQASKFTTAYESVLAFGCLQVVDDDIERMKALELIIDKYSPAYKEIGLKYAQKSFQRTKILRLDIDRFSGKCKRV